jgi:hypothetical protein
MGIQGRIKMYKTYSSPLDNAEATLWYAHPAQERSFSNIHHLRDFGNIGRLLSTILVMVITSTLAIATPAPGREISAAVRAALISDSLTLLRRDNTTIEKNLNLTTYPDAIVELDKTFATVVKIPDDVLK